MADMKNDPRSTGDRDYRDHEPGKSSDTSAIRAEIAETRERMSETLEEIGSRLNPQVVKEQVTQRVKSEIREATIGRVEHMARQAADKVSETRTSLADTIRDNPIPAAMVALGLGWMFMNRGSSSQNRSWASDSRMYGSSEYDSQYDYDSEYDSLGTSAYGSRDRSTMGRARERVGHVAGAAREKVSNAAEAARERVSGIADSTRSHASHLAESARDAADSARERAHHLAHAAADRAQSGRERADDLFQRNPLAVGAITMALGMAAGFAAPRTDREVEFFGDARDKVVDRVQQAAEGAKDKAKNVATRVAGEARSAATRVVEEAKTAAREEGLTGSV